MLFTLSKYKFIIKVVNLMNLYMSPYNLNVNSSGNRYANVFIVYNDGHLNNWNVNNTTPGVRPISF